MKPDKNIPDRFKLVLQFIVFSLGTALLLLLILMFTGSFAFSPKTDFRIVLIWILFVSVGANLWRLVVQWKRLRKQEEAGEIPDYQNPNNIKPFQIVIISVVLPLAVVGYILYELFSKIAGEVCLAVAIMIALLETLYLKFYSKQPNNARTEARKHNAS